MKKILLGLFVLGTLGMAQQNYEVFVKSGVKISQSEVDRDSKEIENLVNKEIIESKIKRNMDYYSKFSTSIVAAEDNKMIVGNIGNSKVKIFRDNELIEEIEGDTIVSLDLKKYDYILSGTAEFWEIVNENEILDMFIRNSSRFSFESELSQKVNSIEVQRKIEIPFLSIFVENLEKEEEEEYTVTTVVERVNPLNYILPMLIAVFFVTAVGKSIYNSRIEKSKKEKVIVQKPSQNQESENMAKINITVKPENVQPQIPAPVVEEKVEGYTATVKDFNVTNSYTPGKTSIQVTKAWDDANDQDGVRPTSVTIKLLADGKETDKKLVLSKENNWTGNFTDLDEYKDGKKIEYTISEETVGKGYTTLITGNVQEGFVVTNKRTPNTPPEKPKNELPKTGTAASLALLGAVALIGGVAVLKFQRKDN